MGAAAEAPGDGLVTNRGPRTAAPASSTSWRPKMTHSRRQGQPVARAGAPADRRHVARSTAMDDQRSQAAATAADITLRPLASHDDYHACYELQLATWGRDFQEGVPPSVLKISQRVGGIAAGAFAAGGELLGYVYGLTGVRPPGSPRSAAALPARAGPARPELFHWSHMLAVAPQARALGLGTRLKLYQRELLLPLGVEVVEWTYDPLEARNAHLNLNRLGAEVVEYVEDMYKGEMGSELARGIGTDRFIVAWRIAGERVRDTVDRVPLESGAGTGGAGEAGEAGAASGPPLPAAPRVRIEIPAHLQEFKDRQPARALAWRLETRRAFQAYLARGHQVTTFLRDAAGRCWDGGRAPAGPGAAPPWPRPRSRWPPGSWRRAPPAGRSPSCSAASPGAFRWGSRSASRRARRRWSPGRARPATAATRRSSSRSRPARTSTSCAPCAGRWGRRRR